MRKVLISLALALVVLLLGRIVYRGLTLPDDCGGKLPPIYMSMMRESFRRYHHDLGRYPSIEEGLSALQSNLRREANWKGPYVTSEQALDPWGRPLRYNSTAEDRFEIVCSGGDGSFDTEDDLWADQTGQNPEIENCSLLW